MRNSTREVVSHHADISDVITAQLCPGSKQPWQQSRIVMDPACELKNNVKRSPTDTGPRLDDICYLIISYCLKE